MVYLSLSAIFFFGRNYSHFKQTLFFLLWLPSLKIVSLFEISDQVKQSVPNTTSKTEYANISSSKADYANFLSSKAEYANILEKKF